MRGPSDTATRPAQRNHIGTISLLIALAGAALCEAGLHFEPFRGASWLRILAAGFEAGLVGGLADWFAVTALFRHPLGLPIPHTAIIPLRRAKIIESIVSMVQEEWLSPEVIRGRLDRFSPGEFVREWLADPQHVERLGAPLRDLLRAVSRLLSEPEIAGFADRALQRQLREVRIDAAAGRWLARVAQSHSAGAAFESLARSLARFAQRPDTAERLRRWLGRSATQLRQDGKILVPLFLRRKVVQRMIVEAACDYASTELLQASADAEHPLRLTLFAALRRFADRLSSGDAELVEQLERVRHAVVDSIEARPLISDLLESLRRQLDDDLSRPDSDLAALVNRQLRSSVRDWLANRENARSFDDWIRQTAGDLIERHHDQIGVTVRENLEALDSATLVAQIEDRVGGDLQYIRLNGAVVGGLVGVLLALLRLLAPLPQ